MVILCYLLFAALILLFVYVIFSWVPRPPEPLLPLVRGVSRIVDPVLEPIRRVMPPLRMGGIGLDLSILVLFFAIYILQFVFC